MHKQEDIPDHIIENIKDLTMKIVESLTPILKDYDPNIVLAALGWHHALMIQQLVSDKEEECMKAAKFAAYNLLNDVERARKSSKKEEDF